MKKQEERRKNKRTMVQDFFSVFIVIPNKHGMAKIYLRDLSKAGLCFRTEMEEPFAAGQVLDLRFYTNPNMYIPLQCRVIRVQDGEVGVEFVHAGEKAVQAMQKLLEFFEIASETAVANTPD